MIRLGVRGKLIVASMSVFLAAATATTIYLDGQLGTWLRSRVESELVRDAHAGATLVERQVATGTTADWSALANEVAAVSATRVVLLDDTGHVLGTSTHQGWRDALATFDWPSAVTAARRSWQAGHLETWADNPDALVILRPTLSGTVIVALALPMEAVGEQRGHFRLLLFVATLIGLSLALATSGFAAHFFFRSLRQLVDQARAITRDPGSVRLDVRTEDELAGLAGSFNRLSQELDDTATALTHERDRSGAVLEGISQAVLLLDGTLRVQLVNRAALTLLGWTSAPAGRRISELLRIPELLDLLKQSSSGHAAGAEFTRVGPPAQRLLARATPLRTMEGIVLVLQDVTEMRRLETVRRDFVANVSHELRTPVAILKANAETLLDGGLEDHEQAVRFSEAILRHADRLSRIVSDLLDLSRFEAGRYEPDMQPVRLQGAARRVAELLEASAKAKNVSIVVDMDPNLFVLADPQGIEQVLQNLVDNAVKYSSADGHVTVRANTSDEDVRTEVIDDGPGIDPVHHPRIFERFYRIDPGRSREQGGTGLGLAIVKHLIEAMGGRVGVQSVKPRGSLFWFGLRAATRESVDDVAEG